ncbi:Acetyltransferase (GNAT) domain-containing protein [Streptomyces sp. 1222.5]|uniref:GNAT family N-acetyltransferase n=1 Tax=unclassified Streptomyces TaxID=2593676 RepID=UPI00089C39DB|nr:MULTISPECIES: GNAT family N-acetyltransferase [unclassified Streptomyces]PKW05988.1 acetyltransferase (GNAT) family protein [Streptomyces sp. 5112.2]SED23796.1 Acetyltransferase (GNAT) domain-containing protein [Streptomyces sp. 1222.5]
MSDHEPAVRYTEVADQDVRSLRTRYCRLRTDAGAPVAELEAVSFRVRFGGVAVAAEGIGGVETEPEFRRRGHMSRLLRQALAGMAQRVDVAFVSDGVEGVYERFGFVGAVAEGALVVPVRNVERASGDDPGAAVPGVRNGLAADLPAMVRLYNTAHAQRPWTHERHVGWNRLVPPSTWKPGSQTLVLHNHGALTGYAVLQGRAFGDPLGSVVADELVAEDASAAALLLAALARLCWERRLSEFTVREPADSLVGRVARHMGCTEQRRFWSSGGMMAAVLNRSELVRKLEPELRRRAAGQWPDQGYDTALAALRRGDLIPDGTALVRLLLGHWSSDDADAAGVAMPDRYRDLCAAWFPGGGSPSLPTPYAHRLDRY